MSLDKCHSSCHDHKNISCCLTFLYPELSYFTLLTGLFVVEGGCNELATDNLEIRDFSFWPIIEE